MSTYLNMTGTKLILEPRIAAFCTRACFVTLGFMRGKFSLFPATRVVVNQGHASRCLNLLTYQRAAVGPIHSKVAGIHPLGADAYERYYDPAVVHTRTGEHCADGYATAGCIEVQLVALAADL